MDQVFLIVVIAAGLLFVGALLGIWAFVRTTRLRRDLDRMAERLARFEQTAAVAPNVAVIEAPDGPLDAAPVAAEREAGPPEAASAALPPPLPGETAPPPLPTQAPAPARTDMEEAIGTRWTVWVGGLALALGGIFLVRYSIEAELLGPGARVLAGLAFAAALLGAGEWLRRSGLGESDAARRAYVPGVLTAAGIVAGFATVYAAYALYGFLGDPAAFLGLGALALVTLALAILHGPALAGLGLAGSYATPLLVASVTPDYQALTIYLFVVTAAALALARGRSWRWLAIAAVAGSVLWGLAMIAGAAWNGQDAPIIAAHLAASFALALAAFIGGLHPIDPRSFVARQDRVAVALLALFALPVLIHVAAFDAEATGLGLMVLLATTYAVAAYEVSAVRGLALAAVALVLLGTASLDVPYPSPVLDPATGLERVPGLGDLLAGGSDRLLGTASLIGLYFAALGLMGTLTSTARPYLAIVGSAIPLGLVAVAYVRLADFAVSPAFGAAALAVAALLAMIVEGLIRRLPRAAIGVDGAVAVYAVAAVAGLGLALAVTLERGALTIALALMVPAIAWVEAARPVTGMRGTALALVALVGVRLLLDPSVVGAELGTAPVFNWLLYGYGVPALAFAVAAWRFGATRMDRTVPIVEAAAVALVTLTAVMLIHHAMTGGDLTAPVSGLAEQGLLVMTFLSVSFGLHWLALRRPGLVFSAGTLVLGGLGLLGAAIGLLGVSNPLVTGEAIDGGPADAALLLGYLIPAIMVFALARLAARRSDRPGWYIATAGAVGGLLAAAYATLAVRAAWHGGDLSAAGIAEAELYAYSAVWLALGLVVLGAGVVLRSRQVRLVSAVIVIAVVAKVFLIDTAGLTGVLRAVSFIGLGAVLVLVGLGYQRLLRRAP